MSSVCRTDLVPLDVGHPVRRQHDVHHVVDESVLQDPVRDRGGAQAGRGVHLDQPGLQVVVDDDVVAVALVAVPVRHHHRGHGLQAVHYQPVDLVEQFVAGNLPPRHLQVQAEVVDGELAAVDVVVVSAVLLDGDVGEVDVQVVHLTDAVVIADSAEPAETKFEEVHLESFVVSIYYFFSLDEFQPQKIFDQNKPKKYNVL